VVGVNRSFTVRASGFPAPAISETGDLLPGGVTFDPLTGILSGTAAANTDGTYRLVFTARNGIGSDAAQNFTLQVNQPAAITSPSSTTFTVGSPGTFTVTASGVPTPALSLSGGSPSGGVTFDPASGVLSGTPLAGTG